MPKDENDMPSSKLNTLDIFSNVRARRVIVFSVVAVGAFVVFCALSTPILILDNLEAQNYGRIYYVLTVTLFAVPATAVLPPTIAAARGVKWGVAVIAAIVTALVPVALRAPAPAYAER